jgi:uncharacterized membrane protein YcaP (DUF421 family)
MFQPGTPIIEIILRTILVYAALLLGLRVAGKREIGQMTVFDLVVLLLIANAVQNAMVGPDSSLTGGVVAALTLLLLNGIIARLRLRIPWLRHWVDGSPTLLVLHGETIARNLNREGIDVETLSAALREHGLGDIKEVEMAVLEIDGSISIIPTNAHTRTVKRPKSLLKR